MGQVFLGRSADGQFVAVKVVRAELAADPGFRARFGQAVAAARKVSGRCTAPVIDADPDAQAPWLATAYVAGASLAEAIRSRGPLPADSVLRLAAGLAESLAAIHAAGLVHRDLKPSHVLLAEDGPWVIDAGISQAAWASTTPGAEFFSPGFMSPEHALGQSIGPPSDVFSLGAVLTFAATGQGPFGSGSDAALLYRLVNSPAELDLLPERLRGLAGSCLAKHPDDRPTASLLLARVGAIQRESDGPAEPTSDVLTGHEPAAGTAGSGRHSRRRFSRSLPLFIPGLLAASAVAVYLLIGAAAPAPASLQTGTVTTSPGIGDQPQAAGTGTTPGSTSGAPDPAPAAPRSPVGPASLRGPAGSAFLSTSAPASALPVPYLPGPVAAGSSSSGSASAAPSPSSSPATSGTPSPTTSGTPSPTTSGTPTPTGSATPTPTPTPTSTPTGSATSTPTTSATSTPTTSATG